MYPGEPILPRTGTGRSQVNRGFDGQLTDRLDISRVGMIPSIGAAAGVRVRTAH